MNFQRQYIDTFHNPHASPFSPNNQTAVSSTLAARGGKAKTNRADYYKPSDGDLDPEEEIISKNLSVVPFPISRLQRFGPCVDMFPEV